MFHGLFHVEHYLVSYELFHVEQIIFSENFQEYLTNPFENVIILS